MSDITLSELLKKMIELGGSDLHITTNSPPQVRVDGLLRPLDYPEMTPAETKQPAYSVLTDAHRFSNALRAALRHDPDVVLIGELRDLETTETALRIAETGHLTFATLHTNTAYSTINRVIDIFPAHQQSQIRAQLSLVLEGILCQALLPKASGSGRAMAMEVLIPNAAIRNLIREDKIHQIYSSMQTGQEKFGMHTL